MDTVKLNCEKKPLMIAHRGLSGIETENTAAAFVAAGNRSYWGIETDIRRTADGQYLLFHDDTLGRVAGEDVTIEGCTLETLRRITLFDRETGAKTRRDLCLATLEEYISVCRKYGKTAVLELKSSIKEEDVYRIAETIEKMGYLERTVFISFHYELLVYLRGRYPAQAAQFLTSTAPDDLVDKLLAGGFDLDIYRKVLTPELVAKCHAHGIKVNVWTVDDPEDAAKFAAWGVDYMTSNILE